MQPLHYGDLVVSPMKGIVSAEAVVEPAVNNCASLFEKLRILESVVSTISEIHPYAKMAFDVIKGVYEVVDQQIERDENIKDLLSVMNDTFSFVTEADALQEKAKAQKHIITLMVQQTTECGYLLQKYARHKTFAERLVKNLLPSVDAAIEEYKTTFTKLNVAFNHHSVLQTQIKVVQIAADLRDMGNTINLVNMPYADGARFQKEKACLPGTRQKILDEITEWINNVDPDGPRVYLLTGAAGTGKSALAHSIAGRFNEIHRLGSSFCFSRNDPGLTPDKLFCTLALDLADQDESRQYMARLAKLDRSTQATKSIAEQFERFVLEIVNSEELDFVGPILFMIDALDESTKAPMRRIMLEHLSRGTKKLPANFHFLVTSRPEDDVMGAFAGNTNVTVKGMDDVPDVYSDMRVYVTGRLTDGPGRFLDGLDGKMCDELARKAEGLFQWANVACDAIRAEGKGGLSPKMRYDRLMTTEARGLDGLYQQVLSDTFGSDMDVMDQFRRVMGLVMTSYEPLSIEAMQELYKFGDLGDPQDVKSILNFMGSLLTGINDHRIPAKPLHTSFRDFLANEARSGQFYINAADHHGRFSSASLRLMIARLKFNTCGLETSYLRNRDVADLEARISEAISPSLSYACRFWSLHLQHTGYNAVIHSSLKEFLHGCLLYWLEALSLLQSVGIAGRLLTNVVQWLQVDDPDLAEYAADGAMFVNAFAPAIAASAPHTYISGLPLTPAQSSVRHDHLPKFQQTLSIRSGHLARWPTLQIILQAHAWVTSVAFSPDGKQVASGSQDQTVRVWDVETGEEVCRPYTGHENAVMSVAFSSDGKRIASGSNDQTVRVWDVETGEEMCRPCTGHTDTVTSVAFSPDGKRVASGSIDRTVRVWDIKTGEEVCRPYTGHGDWVRSVAFSPDGKRAASGSNDRTVRVWDVETGEEVCRPYTEHGDWVRSVAFSPDGKRVASGSHDRTVRVWDVETGEGVCCPFAGHGDWVTSVKFSPDGKQVASGSHDKTVRVWDVETSEVWGPYTGHKDHVTSVTFSPDGKQVASGSMDQTVRVWDIQTGEEACHPYAGHANTVTSVVFSPDGKRVASVSDDATVQVWDVETGEACPPYTGHGDWVRSVAFSPDGKRVASGSDDQTVRVWDVETGEEVCRPYTGHGDWVRSVAFSPDGKRVASGSNDRTVRVWDVETGEDVCRPYAGHTNTVTSVAFSPDGKQVVSGSDDETVRVCDIETGEVCGQQDSGYILGSILEEDGWVVGPNSELLFWVPPRYRKRISVDPRCQMIFGGGTLLDYARFVHGDNWYSCREEVGSNSSLSDESS